jgi:hypothetical protein
MRYRLPTHYHILKPGVPKREASRQLLDLVDSCVLSGDASVVGIILITLLTAVARATR